MDHDYHGQSVRSVYYKIQSYPTPPICFRIAGEYTWEVPHPKFPAELLVLHLLAIAMPTDKEQHGKMVLGLKEQPTRVDS